MRSFTTLLFFTLTFSLYSQNETSIYTDRIVIPRTTTAAIISPTEGTLIYDTSTDGFMYYDGSVWNALGNADSGGAFERNGTVVRQVTGYDTDDFVFGRAELPVNGESITDTFFFFDKSKVAFRGGSLLSSEEWGPDSLGSFSFAYGQNTRASGDNGATALGRFTVASGGQGATALGLGTKANGDNGATALGNSTVASGDNGATALGRFTVASGDGGATALGRFTTASGNSGATALGFQSEASGDNGAIALGHLTEASGDGGATALGFLSEASGDLGATALGYSTKANGLGGTTALGSNTIANGDDGATALGFRTIANGDNCIVIGRYNDTLVSAGQDVIETSPLFIIGNGDVGSGNESNAMVVLKNGNTGIGINSPTSQIEQSFNSTGDNVHIKLIEQGNDGARITMKNDQNDNFWTIYGKPEIADSTSVINFFFKANEGNGANGNKFRIFGDGDATLAGTLTQNSDQRLKTNITPIQNALTTINQINGYSYNWKNDKKASKTHIGVLAQEVQAVLPSLVKTDEEGILSVSYTSLVPVLLEAIKEQQEVIETQNKDLKNQKSVITNHNQRIQKLEMLIAQLVTEE